MWLELLSAFLQKFMEIVLPVLATALAGLVIAWLTKVINEIKSKLSEDAQWIIRQAVNSAVLAAEQVHLNDVLVDKKEYAIRFAQDQLNKSGIKIDLAILANLIEAAVMNEFNRDRVAISRKPTVDSEPE